MTADTIGIIAAIAAATLVLFGAVLGAFYFTLNRLDNVRTELKADIASAADKADAANEHHLIIRADLKALVRR